MSRKRGQALVEFALIAPLFLALFVGLADMGRGLLAYTELAMGSRAAARQAVLQYNAGSDTGSSGCTGQCYAPGVLPIIKKQAGFGFPIADDSSARTNATVTADGSYTANGSVPPYDLTLKSTAPVNTVYLYTYQFDPTSASVNATWPTATTARVSGHLMVVVDLRIRWTSVTLQLLGLSPTLQLDAQTVQRMEY